MSWLIAAVAAAGFVAAPARAAGQEVVVSAAVSLSHALDAIAGIYRERTGERVVLNFGASNMLARQIAAGAKVDLFISADEAQLEFVSSSVEPGSRVELLSNQLAIAVPAASAARIASLRDLAAGGFRRIAIGDPAAVPAGVYAKAHLESLGLWARLAPRMMPTASVRFALAAVENGAADAAIVYATDIRAARRARAAFVVPAAEGPRIVYPAAVMRTGANAAGARAFLAFLQGAEASRLFVEFGFTPVARREPPR